jgi:hypothetical protein
LQLFVPPRITGGYHELRWFKTCWKADMRVRLIKKLADALDGVDLRDHKAGDILELTRAEAELLIAERWAEPLKQRPILFRSNPAPSSAPRPRAVDPAEQTIVNGTEAPAADASSAPRTVEHLRAIRQQMEQSCLGEQERRRAEDRIREEHRDAQAKIIPQQSA